MTHGATGGGSHAATGMSMAGAHGLLPVWLELFGTVVFGLIALSHLRHMARTGGQRRPWHACHVLMGVAMAVMYAPGVIDQLPGVADFGRVALAAAGVLAALWALWGASGSINPVWLLTALDVGAMLYMWSPQSSRTAASAVVILYLLADTVMWTLDAHRSFESLPSLLRWLPADGSRGGTLALPAVAERADALLGDLDISPSMVLMSAGMAYMVLVTQLVG